MPNLYSSVKLHMQNENTELVFMARTAYSSLITREVEGQVNPDPTWDQISPFGLLGTNPSPNFPFVAA